MARSAVGRRRARQTAAAGFSRRVLEECAGVVLLGTALLVALGLASFDPADPILSRTAVGNRAGVLGATAAALALRAFGLGAWAFAGAFGVLGGMLLLGRGVPGLFSRFWAGWALLLVSTATLPVLFAGPGLLGFGGMPRGALGGALADAEALLVGRWGGLVASSALLAIGVL